MAQAQECRDADLGWRYTELTTIQQQRVSRWPLQSTGAQSKRRSRDSYSNRAYSRTQTVRNTGTHNLPLHLMRATFVTNDHSALVYVGDLSPWRHLTARSPCQEVSTTTIHRPLTFDQRHAEFPMCSSQKGTFSHCWPARAAATSLRVFR